jgi:hypothetical protein
MVTQRALDTLKHWAAHLAQECAAQLFAHLLPDSLPIQRRLELAPTVLGVLAPALAHANAESALLPLVVALVPALGWEAMEASFLTHVVPLAGEKVMSVTTELLRLQQLDACRSLLGSRLKLGLSNWSDLPVPVCESALITLLPLCGDLNDSDSVRIVASDASVAGKGSLLVSLMQLLEGSSARRLVLEHMAPPVVSQMRKRLDAIAPPRDIWRMPNALLVQYPELQAFLRGPLQTRSLKVPGARVRAVRLASSLARQYNRPSGSVASLTHLTGFSATFAAQGDCLAVTKTPAQRVLEERAFAELLRHYCLLKQQLESEGVVCSEYTRPAAPPAVPLAAPVAAAPSLAPPGIPPPVPAAAKNAGRKRAASAVIDHP